MIEYHKNGKENIINEVNVVSANADCSLPPLKWSWDTEWGCDCKNGKHQSPIMLLSKSQTFNHKFRLEFNYYNARNLKISYDSLEIIIYGDFGYLNLHNLINGDKIAYLSKKIVFKFPSEHYS